MALGNNYNNNDNKPTVTIYTPISFSNPENSVCESKLNISYFNRLLKVGIALKKNTSSNNNYDTYDNDNQSVVYVSATKAKILADLIKVFKEDKDVHNVSVELKNGLLMVSDGSEHGINNTCITISSADQSGTVNTVVYVTKKDFHKGFVNYDKEKNEYTENVFDNIELDTFEMLLLEYFKASSYAIAASVMEANMYKHAAINNKLVAIAEKLGVSNNNSGGGNYNSGSYFNNAGSKKSDGGMNYSSDDNQEYTASSFDDIANAMKH